VVLELAAIWPSAPIYTSLYRPGSTFPQFATHDVRASPLDRLPVDDGFRSLFPLYPAAFRALGVLAPDLALSSSSGWAHGVRTAPGTFHAVYCHTPARWLYATEHLGASRRTQALTPALGAFRRWDRRAAHRADLYIANSDETRRRIALRYGLQAPVVYPPVDIDRFRPSERGERLLVVSRLLPYKRVDVVVDAATQAGIGLDIVGIGPAMADLQRRAGPTVAFHGRLEDDDVTRLMEACRAFCLPAKEDFGITPVEANAAGKPVVALRAGGALESIEDGVSGCFFDRHDPADLLDAVRRCDRIDTTPEGIAAMARRFSPKAFHDCLLSTLRIAIQAAAEPR
jgi:glycosyltransferase involved in cell wall biosynthesis